MFECEQLKKWCDPWENNKIQALKILRKANNGMFWKTDIYEVTFRTSQWRKAKEIILEVEKCTKTKILPFNIGLEKSEWWEKNNYVGKRWVCSPSLSSFPWIHLQYMKSLFLFRLLQSSSHQRTSVILFITLSMVFHSTNLKRLLFLFKWQSVSLCLSSGSLREKSCSIR